MVLPFPLHLSESVRARPAALLVAALTLVLLAATGCWPFGSARRTAPIELPPPEARSSGSHPSPDAGAAESSEQQPLPPPPAIEPESEGTVAPPEVSAQEPLPGPPTAPPPPATQPAATNSGADSAPSADPPKPVKPAAEAPVPELTRFLSQQERWEYNREIDGLLLKVNETVGVLQQRPLSREQMQVLDRVRTFVKQAAEARSTDLVTARRLANRAHLLTLELERSTR